MRHSGRIEVLQGRQAVIDAAQIYRNVWVAACRHNGIDPGEMFVVFSDNNPYVSFLGPAHRRYQETMAAYEAGGYVGLSMERR